MIDLDQLSKKEYYDIPEGYFEKLPGQVMENIRREKSRRRTVWLSAIAAVAALVICSTILVDQLSNKNEIPGKIVAEEQTIEEKQLENQMIDYYSSELAQMDYYNY